jgi:biofilm PGA synthesis N-glycosyltransferase PgaC
MTEAVFLSAVLLLGYVYLGYPAVIAALAALRPRPLARRGGEPTVSVVIVAHNEAARIAERIDNLMSLDYPRARLEILIASDGSTDETAERARAYEPAGVTVLAFETRRGKAAVVNDVVPKARGEIVVLADARQRFDQRAVRALVAPFADPSVGAVSGQLILTNDHGAAVGEGVGAYWRYEKWIRRQEAQVDSTIGTTGAIYAIRRALFAPIPGDVLLDDVLIPMRIARRGYRVLFEPGALAYDRAAATASEEFTRKVRTIAGNFQLFGRERWLLNPLGNRLWLQTVSHKGLRLLSPLLLAAAVGANLLLLDHVLYGCTFALQLGFYGAALQGWARRNARGGSAIVSVPYVFCLLNWAIAVAFVRLVRGRQRVTWDRASA